MASNYLQRDLVLVIVHLGRVLLIHRWVILVILWWVLILELGRGRVSRRVGRVQVVALWEGLEVVGRLGHVHMSLLGVLSELIGIIEPKVALVTRDGLVLVLQPVGRIGVVGAFKVELPVTLVRECCSTETALIRLLRRFCFGHTRFLWGCFTLNSVGGFLLLRSLSFLSLLAGVFVFG